MKKKAAKKKPAKKKPTKKKKKKLKTKRAVDHCVRLHPQDGVMPKILTMLKGDRVCWRNETNAQRTIDFPTGSPFTPKGSIVVGPDNDVSDFYKIKSGQPKGKVRYTVTPAVPETGPPDGPAVDYQG